MSKFNTFVKNVSNLASHSDNHTMKFVIGDSTDNNRTVTVSQFIRYLRATGRYTDAYNVRVAYIKLKASLVKLRRSKNRTDAFDLNEFSFVLNHFVKYGSPTEKQVLSRSLL